VGKYTIADKL